MTSVSPATPAVSDERIANRWEVAYLESARSDPDAAERALDQLGTISSLPAWMRSLSDPTTRRIILDAIADARNGDPSGLYRLHRANC